MVLGSRRVLEPVIRPVRRWPSGFTDKSVLRRALAGAVQRATNTERRASAMPRPCRTVVCDAGELEILRCTLAEVYERQVAEFEAASLDASVDADVARCPLAYDLSFLSLATNPALLSFCEQLFGPGFVLLQQNGVISRPQRSHYQARWHRDLPYQHWVASKPIAIAALFCLDEFSATTGGTYALPASHLHERFPSEEFVRRHQVVMSAPTGTFIVMNAMMFHRAGKNESTAV